MAPCSSNPQKCTQSHPLAWYNGDVASLCTIHKTKYYLSVCLARNASTLNECVELNCSIFRLVQGVHHFEINPPPPPKNSIRNKVLYSPPPTQKRLYIYHSSRAETGRGCLNQPFVYHPRPFQFFKKKKKTHKTGCMFPFDGCLQVLGSFVPAI